jgi:hypothetical protein
MDSEDRDHFKTIVSQFLEPPDALPRGPSVGNKSGGPDQAYCLWMTQTLFACYRKDEAHDADLYCAAVAAVLGDYSREVIERVVDPRTGIAAEMKFLPAVAEVIAFCDRTVKRLETMAKPRARAAPYVPPPVLPGQIDSTEFNRRIAAGELKPRPIGRFEQPGDEWNKGIR